MVNTRFDLPSGVDTLKILDSRARHLYPSAPLKSGKRGARCPSCPLADAQRIGNLARLGHLLPQERSPLLPHCCPIVAEWQRQLSDSPLAQVLQLLCLGLVWPDLVDDRVGQVGDPAR